MTLAVIMRTAAVIMRTAAVIMQTMHQRFYHDNSQALRFTSQMPGIDPTARAIRKLIHKLIIRFMW